MKKTCWKKPYRGPMQKELAENIARDICLTMNPKENGIHAAIVRRNRNRGYDVWIKIERSYVEKEEQKK